MLFAALPKLCAAITMSPLVVGSLTVTVSPPSFKPSEPVVTMSAPPKAGSFTGGLPPPKMTTARPAASVVFAGKV